MEMIAKGMSTRDVAMVLDLSRHTVDSYRKNLLLKFNARNSAELINKAFQEKVIEINDSKPYKNPNSDIL